MSARQRERVGLVHLDHLEVVVDVAARRVGGQRLADRVDVAGERRVAHHAETPLDLDDLLPVDLLLVLRGHQHDLAPPGGGIHVADAGRADEGRTGEGEGRAPIHGGQRWYRGRPRPPSARGAHR